MSLNDAQKTQIRAFLGYADAWRYTNPRLESIMDNVSLTAEPVIQGYLDSLNAVVAQLSGVALKGAGVKRVDEVWLENGGSQIRETKRLGRMFVSQLSIALGVPPYSDFFGSTGYLGDSFLPATGEVWPGGRYGLG